MENEKQLSPDERLVIVETKVGFIEKEQDKQGKDIATMNQNIEKMREFEIRVGIAVEQLGITTKNIEKSLDNYIVKQEAKEEEGRKAEIQTKDNAVAMWKRIAFETGKWALIALGADKLFFGGSLVDGLQKMFG